MKNSEEFNSVLKNKEKVHFRLLQERLVLN